MNAEALARLRSIARGERQAAVGSQGVTTPWAVTPERPDVTPATLALRKNDEKGRRTAEVREANSPDRVEVDSDAIEERAGLAAECVPAGFLDAWARLNHQKPFDVSEADWRRALDDGGRFLDAWGHDAAALGWTPGDLFDVTGGLVWRLAGARVAAIRADSVCLSDGRSIIRRTLAKRLGAEIPYD